MLRVRVYLELLAYSPLRELCLECVAKVAGFLSIKETEKLSEVSKRVYDAQSRSRYAFVNEVALISNQPSVWDDRWVGKVLEEIGESRRGSSERMCLVQSLYSFFISSRGIRLIEKEDEEAKTAISHPLRSRSRYIWCYAGCLSRVLEVAPRRIDRNNFMEVEFWALRRASRLAPLRFWMWPPNYFADLRGTI